MSKTTRNTHKGRITTKAMFATVPGIRFTHCGFMLTAVIRRENKRGANRKRRRQAISELFS